MILVVQEDPTRDPAGRGLECLDLDVETVSDGHFALTRALDEDVDLVVLELSFPAPGGTDLLAQLQAHRPALPVIVLGTGATPEDRIASLQRGAVDCVLKPFSIDELAARVRALLRLTGRLETTLRSGDLKVDLLKRTLAIQDRAVRLSATEIDLLVYLMQNTGVLLERQKILATVWGYTYDPGTNVVDVYIGYLRRKLREVEARTQITTVRSRGYRLDVCQQPRVLPLTSIGPEWARGSV